MQYCLILGFGRGLLIHNFQLMLCGSLENGPSGVGSEGRLWCSCKQTWWWAQPAVTALFGISSALKEVLYYLESTSAYVAASCGEGIMELLLEFVFQVLEEHVIQCKVQPLTMRGQGSRDVALGDLALGLNLCIYLYWIFLATCMWCVCHLACCKVTA